MTDLGKIKLCLDLQIEHFVDGIFIHQSAYTKKNLKQFYMDKAYPLSTPMIVWSLKVRTDPFRPQVENEESFGPEIRYFSAISALMYLVNATRLDIAFSINLLARYNSSPTGKYWDRFKHILWYLKGTSGVCLLYTKKDNVYLFSHADADYLSDTHKVWSQMGYLFTYGGTIISWGSRKQSIIATSSNHVEIIVIHGTRRECVWLRSLKHFIKKRCGLKSNVKVPTVLFEDSVACIAQLRGSFIKRDRAKHFFPKLFFTHDLQNNGENDIQ